MNPLRLRDTVRSLRVIRRDLDRLIAPELSTSTAQSSLSMIGKLLDMLSQEMAAELRSDPAPLKDIVALAACGLARSHDSIDRVLARNITGLTQTGNADRDQLNALQALLETAAGRDAVSSDPASWRGFDALAAMRAMRDAGSADTDWDASYQESGAGTRNSGSDPLAGQRVEREFSAAELQRYLVASGRIADGSRVTRLQRLPGGYSKGTYLVDLDLPAKERTEHWVLRRDLSFTPLLTCVVDEFPLLSALHERGLPVPEPLWIEHDAAQLGAPLIAVRRISGSGDMAQWAQDEAQARAIALSAARVLASIHAQDLSTLPALQTRAPGSSGETPGDVVAHLEAFWQSVRLEADPLVELVFDWLRRHAPQPGRRTLVHGDYGLHNLLVEDGKLNAILDWEFAHAGDPREDLAYARPFVEKVLPWTEFMSEYQNAGGGPGNDATLRFYTVLGTLRNSLGCMRVLHRLRNDDPGIDSKFIYVGRSYAQQLLRSAAQLTGAMTSN